MPQDSGPFLLLHVDNPGPAQGPHYTHSASRLTVKHLCIGPLDKDMGYQSSIQNRNPALAQT